MSAAADRLAEIFRLVLDLPPDAEVSNVRRVATPRWDSLANATLVTALESEFRITLDAREIDRLTSYRATLLLLDEKLTA